ncbi:MAG: sigma-70 family RNA polymerase sigma factor [Flavobacteriales bacterium]|nr:sigma-70 family RNA polymerase sigma factor [Flavobacteriales bacterium]
MPLIYICLNVTLLNDIVKKERQLANLKDQKDEDIVRDILDTGNHEKFGIIYDRYSDRVYGKCLSFVKNKEVAQDLLHDVFIKCFMNLSNFNFKSRFSTWLYSITYNYCVDFVRKKRKEKFADWDNMQDIPAEQDEANERELLAMKSKRLKKVMEVLNPEIKMLLLMKYQDNLSIKDLTESTGLGESAIKMRLKRSKEKALETYNELFNGHE